VACPATYLWHWRHRRPLWVEVRCDANDVTAGGLVSDALDELEELRQWMVEGIELLDQLLLSNLNGNASF
jgi:hypothetical protein